MATEALKRNVGDVAPCGDHKAGASGFAVGIGRVAALFMLAADKLMQASSGSAIISRRSMVRITPLIAGDPLHQRDGDTGFLTAVDKRTLAG